MSGVALPRPNDPGKGRPARSERGKHPASEARSHRDLESERRSREQRVGSTAARGLERAEGPRKEHAAILPHVFARLRAPQALEGVAKSGQANFRTVISSVSKSKIGAYPESGSMLTDFWNSVWACQQPELSAKTLWYFPQPSLWT